MPQPDKNANTRITFTGMLFLTQKTKKTKKNLLSFVHGLCGWDRWAGKLGPILHRPNSHGLRARNSSLIDWTSNPEVEHNKGLGLVREHRN